MNDKGENKACVEGHEGEVLEVKEEALRKRSWSQSMKIKDTRTFQVQNRAENKTSAEDGPAWPERGEQGRAWGGDPGLRGIHGKEFYPRGGTDVTTLAFQTDHRDQNKEATD